MISSHLHMTCTSIQFVNIRNRKPLISKFVNILILLLLIEPGFSQVTGISSSNLPLVVINTNGQNIQDVAKIPANMKIIFNGTGKVNTPSDLGNVYSGSVGIEVHGAYSATFPQKSYGFETRDKTGNKLNVSLLGMPEENDWILLTNYNDKTFMRNMLAFEISRRLGHYAPRTRIVEVIVNNEYRGIYILTEKIKRDKGRVDIAKLNTTDISGDLVTGGYIFKIDYYDNTNSWQSNFTPIDYPSKPVYYVFEDPSPAELVYQQKNYLKLAVSSFEGKLYTPDFANKSTGYPAWIDVNSFIDYFIVSEVSRNVDGFKKSCYFFKDRNSKGGKINAGPVWDFDWAWKNIWDCSTFAATDGSGWSYKINDCGNIYPNSNGWIVRLLQDPEFADALNKRYFELRNSFLSFGSLQSYIDSVQSLVNEAQVRHYTKWPILSQSVGAPEVDSQPSTYAGQVAMFSQWIKTRLKWLDANMPGKSYNSIEPLQPIFSYRIFPNPVAEIVYVEASSEINEIEVFQNSGGRVIHLTELGTFEVQLNISDLKPGIYLVRLKLNGQPAINSKLIIQ
jgi:hypothetical protein